MTLEFNCQIDSEDMLDVELIEDYTTFSIHKKDAPTLHDFIVSLSKEDSLKLTHALMKKHDIQVPKPRDTTQLVCFYSAEYLIQNDPTPKYGWGTGVFDLTEPLLEQVTKRCVPADLVHNLKVVSFSVLGENNE